MATQFWTAVTQIPGFGVPGAKMKTIAAQPVVLKALAKLTFDFAFSKRKPINAAANLQTLLSGIPAMDYSHTNAGWRYYQLDEVERSAHNLKKLKAYLPSNDEGYNRDLGAFDPTTKVMRFGAKHNDIYPIIGDMFRSALNLPTRHEKTIGVEDI